MNIALSAVIISILLIPPIIFYLSFYLGKYPRAIPKYTLFEGILGTAVVSLFIHAIAIHFIPYEIHYDILIKLLGGELKDLEKKISNAELHDAITSFSYYNICLAAAVIALGRSVRFFLRVTGLHAKYPLLNLYNKWYYIFNGYYNNIEEPDLIFIDVLVDINEGTMIYSGYLYNFDFENGELERIYLKDALRREFRKSNNQGVTGQETLALQPYAIPGDLFSIAYKDILNINVQFIKIDNSLEEIEELPDDEGI